MGRHATWVVVADSARARVFRVAEPGGDLVPAWEDQPVGSKLASREIASDRPGRTFDRAGTGRHAKEPSTDPAQYEGERFAREVADRLDHERKQGTFDRLIVVAAPRFLGNLRAAMPKALRGCVKAEISQDLSMLKPQDIHDHLSGIL